MNKFMNTFLNLNEEEFKTMLLSSDSHEIIVEISRKYLIIFVPDVTLLCYLKAFTLEL